MFINQFQTGFSGGLRESGPASLNADVRHLQGNQPNAESDVPCLRGNAYPRPQSLSKSKRNQQYMLKRQKNTSIFRQIKVIKRNNKLYKALHLPRIVNCNPQSLYNKKEEFMTFISQRENRCCLYIGELGEAKLAIIRIIR